MTFYALTPTEWERLLVQCVPVAPSTEDVELQERVRAKLLERIEQQEADRGWRMTQAVCFGDPEPGVEG